MRPLRFNMLEILVSFFPSFLLLGGGCRGRDGHKGATSQFAEPRISLTAAVPVQFKPAPELRLPPRLDLFFCFFLPHRRSYLGFKWFLSKGLWVNPIRAAHRPVPQPPTKFLCGEKGGTPEQIGLLPPGNRECPVSRSTIMELLTSRIGKSERANEQTNRRTPAGGTT